MCISKKPGLTPHPHPNFLIGLVLGLIALYREENGRHWKQLFVWESRFSSLNSYWLSLSQVLIPEPITSDQNTNQSYERTQYS